jgi:hypothetical protein
MVTLSPDSAKGATAYQISAPPYSSPSLPGPVTRACLVQVSPLVSLTDATVAAPEVDAVPALTASTITSFA